jgi:hypothetical protein
MNAYETEMKYISVTILTSAHLCSEVIKHLKQYNTCMELINARTNNSEALTDILKNSNVLSGIYIYIHVYIHKSQGINQIPIKLISRGRSIRN